MKIEKDFIPESTIEQFMETHDLTVTITERPLAVGEGRFYARVKNAELAECGCLRSAYGNGATPEDAIIRYGQEISERLLVVDAYTERRREIPVPRIKAGK